MHSYINNNEIVIINLAKKYASFLEGGAYDKSKPLGRQIACGLQNSFLSAFLPSFNERYSNDFFDCAALWKALIQHEMNPLYLSFLLDDRMLRGREKKADLLRFHTSSDYFEVAEHLAIFKSEWDGLLDDALSMPMVLEKHMGLAKGRSFDPYEHFVSHAIEDTGGKISPFANHSRHFEPALKAWAASLESIEPTKKARQAEQLIGQLVRGGVTLYDREPINVGRSGPALMVAVKLLSRVDFSGASKNNHDPNEASLLEAFLRLHYPDLMLRESAARALLSVNLDATRKGAFASICEDVELASVALQQLPPAFAMNILGHTFSDLVVNTLKSGSVSFQILQQQLDDYRNMFLALGIGDIKGSEHLDCLCISIESARFFRSTGYVRQNPDLSLYRKTAPADLSVNGEGNPVKIPLGDVDEFLDAWVSIGSLEGLKRDLTEFLRHGKAPEDVMGNQAMAHMVARSIERGIVTCHDVITTEARLRKLLKQGVPGRLLKDSKFFEKMQDEFLARDLGL